MEVTIEPQAGTSIIKSIPIILGDYTILAGKNNSGKTSVIKALKKHFESSGDKVIYIPAEENEPGDGVTKISAAGDDFYQAVDKILSPIFTSDMFKDLEDEFEKSTEKKKFVKAVNSILVDELGVDKKMFNIRLSKEDLKVGTIVKLVKAICRDLYDTEIDEVELQNVGMGTQRMLITALIRYYEESKMEGDDKVVIIIEEPEIYLHPAWKKSLHDSLLKLAAKDNTKVLISTHDPYFITLGREQNIYQVFRDPADNDATALKKTDDDGTLGYKSDAEINYLVFDLPTPAYLMELYEELHAGLSLDDMTSKQRTEWILGQNIGLKTNDTGKEPRFEKTRHKLGHPKEEAHVEDEEMSTGIKELIKLIGIRREEREKAKSS